MLIFWLVNIVNRMQDWGETLKKWLTCFGQKKLKFFFWRKIQLLCSLYLYHKINKMTQ